MILSMQLRDCNGGVIRGSQLLNLSRKKKVGSVETDVGEGDGRKEIGIYCLSRNRLNIIEDNSDGQQAK